MKFSYVFLLIYLLPCACANEPWIQIKENNQDLHFDHFTAKLPPGWMRLSKKTDIYWARPAGDITSTKVNRAFLSRDGLNLEEIDIIRSELKDAFPSLNKQADLSLLPSELAELFIAETKTASGLENIQVIENLPMRIANHDGFMVHMRYKISKGLPIEILAYGFTNKYGFYVFTFKAPGLHFFPTFLPEFKQIVNSARIIPD